MSYGAIRTLFCYWLPFIINILYFIFNILYLSLSIFKFIWYIYNRGKLRRYALIIRRNVSSWSRSVPHLTLCTARQALKACQHVETSRNSYGSFPVIIVKALFEGEVNQCLLGHFRCVIGHSEQSRSTCALCYILGSKVEIVRIICRHGLDHNASGVGVEKWWDKLMRVLSIFLPYGEISTINLLIDCYDHYLWIVIFTPVLSPIFLTVFSRAGISIFGNCILIWGTLKPSR